jgi:hypothetical protein
MHSASLRIGGTHAISESDAPVTGRERRLHRRHDLEQQGLSVERFDRTRRRSIAAQVLGQLIDLSASGVRVRIKGEGATGVQPDQQIRVRIELPTYAGISPFIDTTGPEPRPARQWVGWMTVARVQPVAEGADEVDVAGRLVDMEEIDRGMLGLYLSTQPMAA